MKFCAPAQKEFHSHKKAVPRHSDNSTASLLVLTFAKVKTLGYADA